MKKLRQAVYESNANTQDSVLEVVEETIREVLKELDNRASILCEKYDGTNEFVHFFAGQGMNCRDVAQELGINIDFDPLTNDDLYRDVD